MEGDPHQGEGPRQGEGPHQAGLTPGLSLFDAVMVNAGSMIGSGIFFVSAAIALDLGSPIAILGVWIAGAAISLFGALSIAELGSMFPEAGGQYVYLSRAYSPLWGFLYGWAGFAVINTGSIAAVAVIGATYLGYFIPLTPTDIKLAAAAMVAGLTAVSCFGLGPGAAVQNVLTVLKIASLCAIPVAALAASGESGLLPFTGSGGVAGSDGGANGALSLGSIGSALIAVLWSFEGWIEITYCGSEVKDPRRNIPRSLFIAMLLVSGLYVVVNAAYLHVLSPAGMAGSELVASDMLTAVLGGAGAAAVAAAVILSTAGAGNGFIFTSPRIYYAMARERLFFSWFAEVHPKFRVPMHSLIAQGVLAVALVLTGTFEELATYVVFGSFLFYAMSAAGVIILRKRLPDVARPYRTWGYPATPVIFIGCALFLVVASIADNPGNALYGALIIFAGVPVYFYWRYKRGRR